MAQTYQKLELVVILSFQNVLNVTANTGNSVEANAGE